MDEQDRSDFVEEYYRPYVRPLGNLVIKFALAEAALKELLEELNGGNERDAAQLVDGLQKGEIERRIQAGPFNEEELRDLVESLNDFWNAKDERNRLIHDKWWVGLSSEDEIHIGTRGLPRRKNSEVVSGAPTVNAIWELVRSFHNSGHVFRSFGNQLRRRREGT